MTTRDTTQLLTRQGNVDVDRKFGDWALLVSFGALQWPWLLKSLYGGRARDKAALLAHLGLPADALPNLGSWKADVGMLRRLVDLVEAEAPQTVVELGAGASTLVLAKALQRVGTGRLISFDQHADFVEETRKWVAGHGLSVDLRHAPLISSTGDWRDLWYDLKPLPDVIDLLVIDGPPWTLYPMIRGQAELLFDRLSVGGIVVLDDAARPGERIVARQWRARWPNIEWRFEPGIKGRLIGSKLS